MAGDRDGLRERLPIGALRAALHPGALRERVDGFYAWAFLPPGYTDEESDDGHVPAGTTQSRSDRPDGDGGFDLVEWLDVDPTAGTAPAETDPGETTAGTVATGTDGFGFVDWLTSGQGDPAVPQDAGARDGPPTGRTGSRWVLPPDIPSNYRPEIHPTMVAALALFLTAATLAVLTVGGVLPPLGPVTGLPA